MTSDPISITGPFNSSALEAQFLEGASDTTGTLNPGLQGRNPDLHLPVQPKANSVGHHDWPDGHLQYHAGRGRAAPNANTIFQQINLLPNSQVNAGNVQITRLYVWDITSTSAIVHFKTIGVDGTPTSRRRR